MQKGLALKKLSNYTNTKNMKNHLDKIEYSSLFLTISTFIFLYFYLDFHPLLSLVFPIIIVLPLVIIYNKHYLSKFDSFWSEPYTVVINNITYQFILLYQHYPYGNNVVEQEKRYFQNGLLSMHNAEAIQDGFFKTNIQEKERYWFLGQQYNSLHSVKTAYQLQKNLTQFN